MPSPARVTLFVLLLVTAVVALRAQASGMPVPVGPDRTPVTVVIGWLMVLATPPLLVLLYAAARFRPSPRRPAAGRRPRRSRVVPALLALAALFVVMAALAALARLLSLEVTGGPPSGTSEREPRTSPVPSSEPAVGTGGSAFELAATAVAVALLVLLAVVVLRARRAEPIEVPIAGPADSTGSAPPTLATAAGKALAAVETSGSDPRTAIIGCYAAMERALADAPAAAPRPADAAAEVLRRATEQGQLSPGAGDRLLGLFHEARYSTHPMTDADRSTAANTLRAILADLGRPRWRRS